MKTSTIFSYIILIVSIFSVNPWSVYPIGNTLITFLVYFSVIASVLILKNKVLKKNKVDYVVSLYLIWAFIGIIRGCFVAENYWEWKQWGQNSFSLLLPLLLYVLTYRLVLQKVLTVWFKYALPLFLPIFFLITKDALGFYLSPILILGIFFPLLTKRWKYIVSVLLLLMITIDLGARSTVIKCLVVVVIILSYYFKKYIPSRLLITTLRVMLIIPPVLLYFGLSGIFNVFNMDAYLESNNDNRELLADTRSFIYEEQINSALNNNYVFWGRTPARGFDSVFGEQNAEIIKLANNTKGAEIKHERGSCEVLFLNIFNYLGIIGVVLYSLIYFKAAFLAFKKSNNMYIKMMGLYVAFRWAYGWVEDFNRIDIMNITLWMMIGICYSAQLRKMNNKEIGIWVRGICDKRYRLSSI